MKRLILLLMCMGLLTSCFTLAHPVMDLQDGPLYVGKPLNDVILTYGNPKSYTRGANTMTLYYEVFGSKFVSDPLPRRISRTCFLTIYLRDGYVTNWTYTEL